MGAKIREKSGAWWVFVNHQGRRTSKRIGPGEAGRKAAREAAGKIQAKLALGDCSILERAERPLTVREYGDRWLTVYASVNCKPATVENYHCALALHTYPTLGDLPLGSVTRSHIKTLIAEKLTGGNCRSHGKPLNPHTVGTILAPLRAMFGAAVDDGLIPANPVSRVGRFVGSREATPTERLDPFTAEELRHLLATCRDRFPTEYPFVLTLARAGVRIGEASALSRDDLDCERNLIRVHRGYSRRRLSTPKNGKGRLVDMSGQLRAALREHLDVQTVEATVQGKPLTPWVFGGPDGNPLDYDTWKWKVWRPLLALAGLRYRGPHQLRHTWVSLLLMQGESLAYVSKQAGHASIRLTVDLYGHLIPGANRQAVNRLDDPEAVLDAPKRAPGAPSPEAIPVSIRQN
ncbi:MAG: tyrosine-type recombinase/integrase [Candidatus Methylomirabilota bacterium]|jgi:integrase